MTGARPPPPHRPRSVCPGWVGVCVWGVTSLFAAAAHGRAPASYTTRAPTSYPHAQTRRATDAFRGAGVALLGASSRAQPVAARTARPPGRAPASPAARPHTSYGVLSALRGLAPPRLRREGPLSLRAGDPFSGTTSPPAPPPATAPLPARCRISTLQPRGRV